MRKYQFETEEEPPLMLKTMAFAFYNCFDRSFNLEPAPGRGTL